MAKHIIEKPEETAMVAKNLARTIFKKGTQSQAVVIGLSGELGAGKTTFTQAFAKELGVKETVVSPTFILERIYQLPKPSPFSHLVHIDAYRLANARELSELGWDALVTNPKNLIMIEWADKIDQVLPPDAVRLFFSHRGGDKRHIEMR